MRNIVVKKKDMESSSFLEIAKLLLPEVLVDYFELTHHKLKEEELHFHFKERKLYSIT